MLEEQRKTETAVFICTTTYYEFQSFCGSVAYFYKDFIDVASYDCHHILIVCHMVVLGKVSRIN